MVLCEPAFKRKSRPVDTGDMPEPLKIPASAPLAAARHDLGLALQQPHLALRPLPLPAVALRVTQMAEEDAAAAVLAGLIQKDPGLAAQIIKVANSALYARRSPVTSLQQAISWLGIAEVRKLAVSCALHAQLFAGRSAERVLAPVWAESLASANFAQEIARLRRRSVEPAYLCGLLHRGGYASLIQTLAANKTHAGLLADGSAVAELAAEFEAPLAQFLAKDWGLPDVVAVGLRYWRTPGDPQALQLAKPSRLALLEIVLARVLSAQLQVAAAVASDAIPPELASAAAPIIEELGIYQDDIATLWSKREFVINSVESLK